MNLAKNLEAAAFYFPERPALRDGGLEITYGQLNEQANRVATALTGLGLQPGEHVALCAPNSADWITFYFGVLKTGAVAVTLSALLSGGELGLLLHHARPRFVFAAENKRTALETLQASCGIEKLICPGGDLNLAGLLAAGSATFRALDRDRADTAAVLYTGGTTGTPKGVMLTHEGINFSAHSTAQYERSTEHDRALCFMPFNHVFGQIHIMNGTILSCGCLEILPGFDLDRILEAVAAGRVTKFYAVPTVYIRLLGLPDLEQRLGRLRYCFSAAASMAREIVKQWKERTGITIAESYGMTEGMPVTYNHYYPERHRVGSVGTVVPGVEVQIRDTSGKILKTGQQGEICVRGRNVMKGYLNNPEATAAAFWEGEWLRSGDIGVFDDDGYLFIVDRLKDLIITGGENVYPREVEEALYQHPQVEECAVVGRPDPEWGERVVAFIVPRNGKTVAPEELKSFLKTRLSPFKVPKEYVTVRELPKSPAGKLLKRELREKG
ncbi:MAG: AMP-binding protein [Desulfobacterota bacterium]|nr:AMP-binding protein [Thermodesulfobacteriota bacterium]